MKPEVLVGTIRRRRRSTPQPPDVPPPPNLRNWIVFSSLTLVVAALMFIGFLTDHPKTLPLPRLSQAIEVRSTIAEQDDSLAVVVAWDLTLSEPEGVPKTVRVRVIPEPAQNVVTSIQPGNQLADTTYIPAPPPGQTLKGISCVAAQHPTEETVEETCTPWQYVRPSASVMAATAAMSRIVIQPSGLQVDPDVGGRCARWQRTHPADQVWIRVNHSAVAECTGPNRKPTVAQFCAFAVLPDGRKMKTPSSINNPYCEELFAEWIRERIS